MMCRVYGTAGGGTERVLACVRGVLRGSFSAPGDKAIGADQQRAVRLEAMRGGCHHFGTSQLHTEAIYTSSSTPSRCIIHTPQPRSTPRHWPRQASSTKRRPYRSRWWKNLPAAEGDFYVRSPGTRLTRYSSLWEQRRDVSSDAPSTADERYRGSPSSPCPRSR